MSTMRKFLLERFNNLSILFAALRVMSRKQFPETMSQTAVTTTMSPWLIEQREPLAVPLYEFV
ncbi:6346_t:CDS:2 [Rhizophagus irregularis]|nr:6346_t:CDS:2 [Rhizophagus irregularis]